MVRSWLVIDDRTRRTARQTVTSTSGTTKMSAVSGMDVSSQRPAGYQAHLEKTYGVVGDREHRKASTACWDMDLRAVRSSTDASKEAFWSSSWT